jgi:hypothetical protein
MPDQGVHSPIAVLGQNVGRHLPICPATERLKAIFAGIWVTGRCASTRLLHHDGEAEIGLGRPLSAHRGKVRKTSPISGTGDRTGGCRCWSVSRRKQLPLPWRAGTRPRSFQPPAHHAAHAVRVSAEHPANRHPASPCRLRQARLRQLMQPVLRSKPVLRLAAGRRVRCRRESQRDASTRTGASEAGSGAGTGGTSSIGFDGAGAGTLST